MEISERRAVVDRIACGQLDGHRGQDERYDGVTGVKSDYVRYSNACSALSRNVLQKKRRGRKATQTVQNHCLVAGLRGSPQEVW